MARASMAGNAALAANAATNAWISAGFMHYDLGYIDLEQKTLQTLDNPFGARL